MDITKIKAFVVCDRCGARYDLKISEDQDDMYCPRIHIGSPLLTTPGWQEFNGQLFCEKHWIKTTHEIVDREG